MIPFFASFFSSSAEREVIDLTKVVGSQPLFYGARFLRGVFSPEECQRLIELSEKKGYEAALINNGGTQVLATDIRNSQRCMLDDQGEADNIFQKISKELPEVIYTTAGENDLVGLNERLRFLKYGPGEYFRPHYDGCFVRGTKERSYITVQIYLNEGFEGGETNFISEGEEVGADPGVHISIRPEVGSVLIFEHGLLHEGAELKTGTKYCIRTDVMYSL